MLTYDRSTQNITLQNISGEGGGGQGRQASCALELAVIDDLNLLLFFSPDDFTQKFQHEHIRA